MALGTAPGDAPATDTAAAFVPQVSAQMRAMYAALSQRMPTEQRSQGGATFEYISGEQCISALNEHLGPHNWDFVIDKSWYDQNVDCVMVQGTMVLRWVDESGVTAVSKHSDIGSQQPTRRGDGSLVNEFGFNFKGATTDCIKRCAVHIGVGLFLYDKANRPGFGQSGGSQAGGGNGYQAGGQPNRGYQPNTPAQGGQPPRATSSGGSASATGYGQGQFQAATPANQGARPPQGQFAAVANDPNLPTCADCGNMIQEVHFKRGDVWSPQDVANWSHQKYGLYLCMTDAKKRKDAAEAAGGGQPGGYQPGNAGGNRGGGPPAYATAAPNPAATQQALGYDEPDVAAGGDADLPF